MNLYHILLKAFLHKELYIKYSKYIDSNFIKENAPNLYKLFLCLETLHQKTENILLSLSDLELELAILYPNYSRTEFQAIFSKLEETNIDLEKISEYCEGLQQRQNATNIAAVALEVAAGEREIQDLQNVLSELGSKKESTENEDFIDDTLEKLVDSQQIATGLHWPLDSLNKNLGSLRTGDFGFVFARPETGKTTFLATVVPYMAGQTDRPVLWFNNEEQGNKVALRCYQGALGVTIQELYSDIPRFQVEYKEKTKGNIKIINDASITKQRVERLCSQYNPSLVIFDQIDHIKGFRHDDRNDIELKTIYIWARELAKTYCPIIAICQAGASGEGKRWLTMGDVDNSKTGKQSAADWILGIGRSNDEGLEGIRYLSLSKNKLIGDQIANGERHGRWEVRIRPELARYEDF